MSNVFSEMDYEELELNNREEKKYRSTRHIKRWSLLGLGFFLLFVISSVLVPTDRVNNPTNEFSFILMIGFIGLIIAIDHLISGYVYYKKGGVK